MAKADPPGVIRGVYGTVVSFDLGNHRCILNMEVRRSPLGNGVLDTRELEESLEGVSDLKNFLSISTQFITKIKPLTTERADELGWHDGKWEAMWIRPKGIRPDVHQIPAKFVSYGRMGQQNSPSIEYCKQDLVAPSGRSGGPTPEKTADAISAFRKIFKHWDVFPLPEVLNVLRNRDEFSDLKDFFKSTQDISSFAKSLPQYFVVTIGDRALGSPYRFSEEAYRAFLKEQGRQFKRGGDPPPYVLVNHVEECQRHVRMLRERANESEKNLVVVAVDCEGVKLGKEGPLTLVQIGTVEGEVFVFDIMATPNREDMFVRGGLKELLEDTAILKVIHDCRSDNSALYNQFGVVIKNVFDTSVAYTTIWEQCNTLSGPFRPKLAMLLEIYGLKAQHKTEAFNEQIHGELFGERPLTQEMIEYAIDDVLCLVPTIYENMNRLISPLWRSHFERKVELALTESRDIDPRQMYERKKDKQ